MPRRMIAFGCSVLLSLGVIAASPAAGWATPLASPETELTTPTPNTRGEEDSPTEQPHTKKTISDQGESASNQGESLGDQGEEHVAPKPEEANAEGQDVTAAASKDPGHLFPDIGDSCTQNSINAASRVCWHVPESLPQESVSIRFKAGGDGARVLVFDRTGKDKEHYIDGNKERTLQISRGETIAIQAAKMPWDSHSMKVTAVDVPDSQMLNSRVMYSSDAAVLVGTKLTVTNSLGFPLIVKFFSSGFDSKKGVGGLLPPPTDTSLRMEPGQSLDPKVLVAMVERKFKQDDSRLFLDVENANDPSDRTRVELRQSKRFMNSYSIVEPLRVSTAGATSFTPRLEQTRVESWNNHYSLAVTGEFTLTLGSSEVSRTAPTVGASRVTREITPETDSASRGWLSRPVSKVTVGDAVRTYSGAVPGRIDFPAAPVEGFRPSPEGGVWEALGQLQSNKAPVIDEAQKTVTAGGSVFYHQEGPDTAYPVGSIEMNSSYLIAPPYSDKALDRALASGNNDAILWDRHAGHNQVWTLQRVTAGVFQVANDGRCLTRHPDNRVDVQACTLGQETQQWRSSAVKKGNTFKLLTVDRSAALTRTNSDALTVAAAHNSADDVQVWEFSDAAKKQPITQIRLGNGWGTETAPVNLFDLRPPAPLSLGNSALKSIEIDATSGTQVDAQVVPNGVDSRQVRVSVKEGAPSDTPKLIPASGSDLSRAYDYVYFTEKDTGALVTNLTQPSQKATSMSPTKPWSYDGDDKKNAFYYSTTSAATKRFTANVAINDSFLDSASSPLFYSTKEIAVLGDGNVDTGIALHCGYEGSSTLLCPIADGNGALYADLTGATRITTSYTAATSWTDPNTKPDNKAGMYSTPITKMDANRVLGNKPTQRDNPNTPVLLRIAVITHNGTITTNDEIRG